MLFVELIAQGLVQGSIYALIALGLTLVYGLLRILHVAHAALFTLGGYVGVMVTNQTGSLAAAIVAAMIVAGVGGVLMFRLCYQPILHQPPFVPLIASIGLYIAAEEIFRIIFGPQGLTYKHEFLQGQVTLFGSLRFKEAEIAVMLGSAAIIGVLSLLQTRTRIGVACQATVSDPQMAESFGISPQKVRDINFFVGSALAGVRRRHGGGAEQPGGADHGQRALLQGAGHHRARRLGLGARHPGGGAGARRGGVLRHDLRRTSCSTAMRSPSPS